MVVQAEIDPCHLEPRSLREKRELGGLHEGHLVESGDGGFEPFDVPGASSAAGRSLGALKSDLRQSKVGPGVVGLQLEGSLEIPLGIVEILLQAAHVSQEIEDNFLAIAVDPRPGPVDRRLNEALLSLVEVTELIEAEPDRELGQRRDLGSQALGGDAQSPGVCAENGLVVHCIGAGELLGAGQTAVRDEELGGEQGRAVLGVQGAVDDHVGGDSRGELGRFLGPFLWGVPRQRPYLVRTGHRHLDVGLFGHRLVDLAVQGLGDTRGRLASRRELGNRDVEITPDWPQCHHDVGCGRRLGPILVPNGEAKRVRSSITGWAGVGDQATTQIGDAAAMRRLVVDRDRQLAGSVILDPFEKIDLGGNVPDRGHRLRSDGWWPIAPNYERHTEHRDYQDCRAQPGPQREPVPSATPASDVVDQVVDVVVESIRSHRDRLTARQGLQRLGQLVGGGQVGVSDQDRDHLNPPHLQRDGDLPTHPVFRVVETALAPGVGG